MKNVRISIALPANILSKQAKNILVEIRDASLADASAALITEKQLHNAVLAPNGNLEVVLNIPETNPKQILIVRVHISIDGSNQIKSGDLLTTSFIEIPADLGNNKLIVPVTLIN
ncbi:MAG: hypothetical protein AABY47_07015 [Pseudomonadota bacterium]|mgnify:CR=1 FL=1